MQMRYRLRLGCSRLIAAEAPSSLRSLIEETYSGSPSESSESEPTSGGGMPASRRSLNTEKIGLPHRMKLLGHSSLGLGSMELFKGGWVRGTKATKSMAVLNTVSSVLVCGSTETSTNPLIYFLKKAPFVITVRIIVRITTGRVLARDHFPRPRPRNAYGFTCTCELCARPAPARALSDSVRAQLEDITSHGDQFPDAYLGMGARDVRGTMHCSARSNSRSRLALRPSRGLAYRCVKIHCAVWNTAAWKLLSVP